MVSQSSHRTSSMFHLRRSALSFFFTMALAMQLVTTQASASSSQNNAPVQQASSAQSTEDATTAKLREIFERSMQSSVLAEWLDERINFAIKHGLDAAVDQYLRNSAFVQRVLHDLEKALTENHRNTRLVFTSQMGLAMHADQRGLGEQYSQELLMATDVARQLNFPQSAIEDLHLFRSSQNVVNAFTYSGLPRSFIDVVLFQGLVDLLSPQELRAVIGHEMGHIKARHVQNQVLLVSIFRATGENAIPADPESQALRAQLVNRLTSGLTSILAHSHRGTEFPAEIADTLVQNTLESIDATTELLKRTLRPEEISALNHDLTQILAAADSHGASGSTPEASVVRTRPFTQEDVEKFLEALKRYSRSCETSSDRYGLLVSDLESAMATDAKLAGGRNANIHAIRRQADRLIESLNRYPHAEQTVIDSQETHPAPVMRAVQYELFMQTTAYQIYSSPFWKALDAYVGISRVIEGSEPKPISSLARSRSVNPDSRELLRSYRNASKMTDFYEFSQELSATLKSGILDEFFNIGQQSNFEKFHNLILYFNEARRSGKVPRITVLPGGLLFDLREALKAIPQQNDLIRKAVALINTFIPLEARNATGDTIDPVEAQLHEFNSHVCALSLGQK